MNSKAWLSMHSKEVGQYELIRLEGLPGISIACFQDFGKRPSFKQTLNKLLNKAIALIVRIKKLEFLDVERVA